MSKLSIHIHGDEYYYSQLYAFLPFRNEDDLVPEGETAANILLCNEKRLDLSSIPYFKFQKELDNAIRMLRLIEAGEKEFSHLLNPNTSDFEQNICAQEDELSNPYQFIDHADIQKDLTAINDIDDPNLNSDDQSIHANFVDQTIQIQYRDIAIKVTVNL